jgi:hypothetical protein
MIASHREDQQATADVLKRQQAVDALAAAEKRLLADEATLKSWAGKMSTEYGKRRAALDKRRQALRNERQRLALLSLLGVPQGVRVYVRYPNDRRESVLNDRFGTLTEVRRTRGIVDFGEVNGDARPWDFLLIHLIPAGEEQGCTVRLN